VGKHSDLVLSHPPYHDRISYSGSEWGGEGERTVYEVRVGFLCCFHLYFSPQRSCLRSYIRNRSFLADISADISFFWNTAVAYAFIALVNTFAGECAPPCFISASFWRITLAGIFAATRVSRSFVLLTCERDVSEARERLVFPRS
jgi:hypothetical protein